MADDALLESFVRLRAKAADNFEGEARDTVLPGIKRLAEDAALTFAATKIFDVGKQGLDELKDAQAVAAQTASAITATGGAAGVSADQVAELASKLSDLSGHDDEAIQKGENLLLTFKNVRNEVGEGSAVFDRATAAALDLSQSGFGSIESASTMLGKALNDPVAGLTALGRAGVTFSDDQKATIKSLTETGDLLGAQKIILGEVESQVGGAAKAYGETLPGQLERAQTAMDNAKGAMVAGLAPAIEVGATLATNLATSFQQLPEPLQETIGAIALVGGGLGALARPASDVYNLVRNLRTAHEAAAVAVEAQTAATEGLTIAESEAAVASKGLIASLGPIAALAAALGAYKVVQDQVGTEHDLLDHVLKQNDAYASLSEQIQAMTDKTRASDEEMAKSKQALADEAEAVSSLATAYQSLIDGTLNQFEAQLRLSDAQIATRKSIDDLDKARREGKLSADEGLKLTNDTFEAILNEAKANEDLAVSMAAGKTETEKAQIAQRALIDELYAVAATLAPGSDLQVQIGDYIAKLQSTPASVSTSFNLDTAEAVRALQDLQRQLAGIAPGANVDINFYGDKGPTKAHAMGGSVMAGEVIHAAEYGEELIRLNKGPGLYQVPYDVVPAPQTAQVLGGRTEEHFHQTLIFQGDVDPAKAARRAAREHVITVSRRRR